MFSSLYEEVKMKVNSLRILGKSPLTINWYNQNLS